MNAGSDRSASRTHARRGALVLALASSGALSCKGDDGGAADTGTGSTSEGSSGPPPMSDSTGTLGPCTTDLQPHGQCLEPLEFGDDPILDLRVGVFTSDGRESIATQAVQNLSLGRLYADDAGEIVLAQGDPIELSAPWELVVGRFHADAVADEILWVEPDFSAFHFFVAGDAGFAPTIDEPLAETSLGQSLVAYDVDLDGDDEIYEINLSGSARLIAAAAGSWFSSGEYEFGGGPVGDAGVVLDADHDGMAELVVPLAGNTASGYDPSVHRFAAYAGLGTMLVLEGVTPAGDKPFYLDAGDFDGDGYDDLLVKGDDVGVILSSAEGLGEHQSLMLLGGVVTRARACDIDGDGVHEVVTLPPQTGGSLLLWADVLGTVAIETIAQVTKPQELECPDLDGDGRDEIVYHDDATLRVLRPLETL